MTELYWITRTDAVLSLAWAVFIVALIVLIFVFAYLNTVYDKEEIDAFKKFCSKYAWMEFTAIIVSTLLIVFVPSRKEMMIIFGVGGAIEYVKDNDKAKQLPDKVVAAIDAYLESLKEEKK